MLSIKNEIIFFILQQLINLIGILPFVLAGAFICKGKLFEKLYNFLNKHLPSRWYNPVLIITWIVLFLLTNLLHKAVLIGTVALINFLLFNLFKKPKSINKAFMFLGKHSTNMWLTHMFFYLYIFTKAQTFFRIILPQVIKRIMPSMTNEVVTLVKDTSLAFTVSYVEMFTIGKNLANSQTSFVPFIVAGVFYFVFNAIVDFVMGRAEKSMNYYQ